MDDTKLTALTVDDATLPVIDLSGLFTDDPAEKTRVAKALGAAARTSGFFYITGHGVPQDLVDATFAASKEFHEKAGPRCTHLPKVGSDPRKPDSTSPDEVLGGRVPSRALNTAEAEGGH